MSTIKDIANLAGVSRGTVDRVLNKRGGVHPDTQAKVMEIDKNDPKYKNSEQLITLMNEEILNIQNALKRGYPYEEYNDFLSYGTEYVEKSISNTLRRDRSLLELILERDAL